MKLDPEEEARVAAHADETEAWLRQALLGRTYCIQSLPTPRNVGYSEGPLIAERLIERGVLGKIQPTCSNLIGHEEEVGVALPPLGRFPDEDVECPECGETTPGYEIHYWRALVGLTMDEMERLRAEKEAVAVDEKRLRDAAPDLLAACKAALPEIRCLWGQLTGRPTNQIEGGTQGVLEQIESAIAKADEPAT